MGTWVVILAKGLIDLGIRAIEEGRAQGHVTEDDTKAAINQVKSDLDALVERIVSRKPKIPVEE